MNSGQNSNDPTRENRIKILLGVTIAASELVIVFFDARSRLDFARFDGAFADRFERGFRFVWNLAEQNTSRTD